MKETIKLQKEVIDKIKFPKIIDIEFNQLISTNQPTSSLTVEDFFELYDELFYEIPSEGELNSHIELIKRSSDYIGEVVNNDEIDILLEEINQLRLELLESRKIIDDLTK